MTLVQFSNCLEGYEERTRNDYKKLAYHAMAVRTVIFGKKPTMESILPFPSDGKSNSSKFKEPKDMTKEELAKVKERLKKSKEFFDANPHPDLISVN